MNKVVVFAFIALVFVGTASSQAPNPTKGHRSLTIAKGSHSGAVEFDSLNPPTPEEWVEIKRGFVAAWEHTDKFRSEVLPAVKK